jgi:acyl-coenzyme A synthetase/AMP-(fatty) acid ligase
MPGYDVQVLDEGGKPVAPDTMGTIAIKLPLPPGCLPTLWQADERFRESYSPRSQATTTPRMPASSTGTAMST